MISGHLMGTYDANGKFRIQTVNLGRTQSDKPGLFTAGCMAMPLSEEEFAMLNGMAFCEALGYVEGRWGFRLVGGR